MNVNTNDRPENMLAATKAIPVLAGLLQYPDEWPIVRDALGTRLIVAPKQVMSGDAWTRTAWAALATIFEAGQEPDAFLLAEQMERLASHKRKGLLDGLTDADRGRAGGLLAEGAKIGKAREVLAAAERLADYLDGLVVRNELDGYVESLTSGGLLNPSDMLQRLDATVRSRCRPRHTLPIGNLGSVTARMFAERKQTHVDSGLPGIEIEIGVTELGGESGKGKSATMVAMMLGHVFPNTVKREHTKDVLKRARVNTAPKRPHLLFVSAEMTGADLAKRAAANVLRISSNDLNRLDTDEAQRTIDQLSTEPGRVSPDTFVERLNQYGRATLIDAEILGSITAGAVVSALNEWADRVREEDPDGTLIAFVDYAQHLDADANDESKERYEQIARAVKAVNTVALRHRVAVVVGLQLNDSPGLEEPNRASISGAKAVINLAKSVLLLHAWTPEQRINLRGAGKSDSIVNAMSIISAKARSGAGARVLFEFDGEHATISQPEKANYNPLRDRDIIAIANGKPKPKRRKQDDELTLGGDEGWS